MNTALKIHTRHPDPNYRPMIKHPGIWTTAKNIRLFKQVLAGMSAVTIAPILGFTPDDIRAQRSWLFSDYRPNHQVNRKAMKALNQQPKNRLPKAKSPQEKRANEPMEVGRKTDGRVDWLNHHDEKILRMARLGQTAEEMAAALGGVDATEVAFRKMALNMTGLR